VGKWHAGDYWTPMPGFDTWFTSLKGTHARFGEHAFVDGTERVRFRGHQETAVTDRAVRFLREAAEGEEPFFLYVGYTNTHTPHTGETAPLVNQYRKCGFGDIPRETYEGEHGHNRVASFDPDEPERREQLAQYYAAVEAIDQQMVRIISELESLGQLENTWIVYTGDHGHMNGHHGLHTKINATLPGNFLEETIHVPLLMRPPGGIPGGRVVEAPVDHCDLFATVLDAAGEDAEARAERQVSPGRSVLPLVWGEAVSWRNRQFCESGMNRMVSDGRLKYIRRWPHPSGLEVEDELYDLRKDPRERVNRIGDEAYAEAVEDFRRDLEVFYARYEDPAMSGLTEEGRAPRHNPHEPWSTLPGDNDHRQGG